VRGVLRLLDHDAPDHPGVLLGVAAAGALRAGEGIGPALVSLRRECGNDEIVACRDVVGGRQPELAHAREPVPGIGCARGIDVAEDERVRRSDIQHERRRDRSSGVEVPGPHAHHDRLHGAGRRGRGRRRRRRRRRSSERDARTRSRRGRWTGDVVGVVTGRGREQDRGRRGERADGSR